MRWCGRWVGGPLLCLCLGAPGVVRAAEPAPAASTPEEQAQQLADDAAAAYRAGNLPQALQLSQKAYGLRNEPTLLYNQARIYEKMGQQAAGLEYYRRYLVADGIDPKLKAKAEERVAALSQAPQPAQRPEMTTTGPGAGPAKQAPPPPGRKLLVAGIALAALGVAGVGAGVGLYAAASSGPYSDYQGAMSVFDKRDAINRLGPLSTGSIVGYTVGGVLLAGGAALIGLSVRERLHKRRAGVALNSIAEREAPRLSIGPQLPLLGGDGAGLVVGGGF